MSLCQRAGKLGAKPNAWNTDEGGRACCVGCCRTAVTKLCSQTRTSTFELDLLGRQGLLLLPDPPRPSLEGSGLTREAGASKAQFQYSIVPSFSCCEAASSRIPCVRSLHREACRGLFRPESSFACKPSPCHNSLPLSRIGRLPATRRTVGWTAPCRHWRRFVNL